MTPPTTIPAASSRDSDTTLGTTNAKMSGNLTILSNSNYYQTCLACKEQAEICEGRKNIDDS